MSAEIEKNQVSGSAGKSRAVGFFLTEQYEKALAAYDVLLEKNPDDVVLLSDKALCLMLLGRIDENFFDPFFKRIDEMPAASLVCLAEASVILKSFGQALDLSDEAIRRDETNIEAYLLKAEVLDFLGKGDDLLALLKQVYPRFQNDERVLCFAAGYAARFGNTRQAGFLFKKALRRNRPYVLQNPRFYDFFLSNEEEKKLIPYAVEALKTSADNKDVLHALAVAYALTGQLDQADAVFEKLSAQYEVMPDHLKSLWADALAGSKKYGRAFDVACQISDEYEYKDGVFLFLRKMLYFLKTSGASAEAEQKAAEWMEKYPDNIGIKHTCAAILEKKNTETPPAEYAKEFFDAFAPDFDATLAQLKYQGSYLVAKVLDEAGLSQDVSRRILDAGCGTGLLADSLLPYTGQEGSLTGVDVSGRMLDEAREKVLYSKLENADIVPYMDSRAEQFDLIACMDVLSYFGNLNPVFHGFKTALKSKGLVIFSVLKNAEETAGNYDLQLSGQYMHRIEYVLQEIQKAGFKVLDSREHILRYEFEKPVLSLAVLAEKENAA